VGCCGDESRDVITFVVFRSFEKWRWLLVMRYVARAPSPAAFDFGVVLVFAFDLGEITMSRKDTTSVFEPALSERQRVEGCHKSQPN
jgi:hypothetical protein